MLTNQDFARYTTLIARRASAWSFDLMTMGKDRLDKPPINDSTERFCKDIEEVLIWLRSSEHDQK